MNHICVFYAHKYRFTVPVCRQATSNIKSTHKHNTGVHLLWASAALYNLQEEIVFHVYLFLLWTIQVLRITCSPARTFHFCHSFPLYFRFVCLSNRISSGLHLQLLFIDIKMKYPTAFKLLVSCLSRVPFWWYVIRIHLKNIFMALILEPWQTGSIESKQVFKAKAIKHSE